MWRFEGRRKGPQGQHAGTIATSPKEVDKIIREVYGEIYKGNLGDRQEAERMADIYMEEYQDFILDQPEAIAEDIMAEDVANIVNKRRQQDVWIN